MKAVVTGAASGIGGATALKLAAAARARREDAAILLVDRDDAGTRTIAAELENKGAAAHALRCDLSDLTAGDLIAEASQRLLGGVDVVVSNAGMIRPGALVETPVEEYEAAFAVNTRAMWLIAKACHRMLKASHGNLVATASLSGAHPTAGYGAYSASKSAVIMLVRQLAYEWAPDGVRCNSVSPGNIHTGMNDRTYRDPQARSAAAAMIPLGRLGHPEDVAAAIAFLASPEACYITGADLVVDGGMSTTLVPHMRR